MSNTEVVKLPAGMEVALRFYATNATEPDAHDGVNARIQLDGKTDTSGLSNVELTSFPVEETLNGLNDQFGGIWRAMTSSEIKAYKEDEGD